MEQSALVKELVNELFTVMETIFKEMQVCWETVREDQANCLGCVFFSKLRVPACAGGLNHSAGQCLEELWICVSSGRGALSLKIG